MLNRASLSLEQAPPISVPFRFFLTAPLFGLAAALLLVFYGPEALITRWAPTTLALTHLLTLGFLGLIMCGAIMQMLPVVAGSPVPAVTPVATAVHLLLSGGTLILVGAFLQASTLLFHIAVIALGCGWLAFIVSVWIALRRVTLPNHTVTGMRLAVIALGITVTLGLTLGCGFAGSITLTRAVALTDIHLGWGILGWIGLLVMGVSYQVVPMFQLTSEYPDWMTRFLTRCVFAALLAWAMLYLAADFGYIPRQAADFWVLIPASGYLIFSATTLRLQQRRRRKISDVTLLFWRTGMVAAAIALILWLAGRLPGFGSRADYPLLMGACLLLGTALSVINGMLYKIVPFLAWFHLQNRQLALQKIGVVKVPNMKELLPDAPAKRQLYAHLLSLALLLAAILWPTLFTRPAGIAFGLSCLLLWLNLLNATRRYTQVNRELSQSTPSS